MNKKLIPSAIWITGITASGKTTLATLLLKKLNYYNNIKLVDGEEFRKVFGEKYGYEHKALKFTKTSRNLLSNYFIKEVKDYVDSGYFVITATQDFQLKSRQKARNRIKYFYEVYLNCTADICAKRDYKGHYQKAYNKEYGYEAFPGVTVPYETTDNPELTINTGELNINDSLEVLYLNIIKSFYIK